MLEINNDYSHWDHLIFDVEPIDYSFFIFVFTFTTRVVIVMVFVESESLMDMLRISFIKSKG